MGLQVPRREQVSAVLVTYGTPDIHLNRVIETLPFTDIVVWDNSERENLQCYGRFAAIPEAKHPHIYVQDDDLTVDALALLERYDGTGIVANVPPDEEWDFIGGGAFFPRDLPNFQPYTDRHGAGTDFDRVCDVVFAYGHPYQRTWVGYREMLPWHDAENRMYRQADHYLVRERARERTLKLRAEGAWTEDQPSP